MPGELPNDRDRPRGGPGVVSMCLIRALIRQGIEVTAIEWASPRGEPYDDEAIGCRVIPLPLRRPAFLGNAFRSPREVRRIVDELQPDLVHVQSIPELGWRLHCPRVLTIRGINPRDEWLLGGLRRFVTTPIMAATFYGAVRHYDHVIAISPYTREAARIPDRVQVHSIPNPVEEAFFDVERGDDRPTVLTVGVLSELKNTMGVVQAAAQIRQAVPGVAFRIAGPWRPSSAAYRQRVERFCQEKGLGEVVRFLGYVDRDALKVEMARASCLLLPSFQENSPVVIAEAMAAGLPILASRICGIPFLVKEGETGLLFDPLRSEEVVASLRQILTDDARRQRMGRAAREDARTRFQVDAVARQHVEVYRRAMADCPSS